MKKATPFLLALAVCCGAFLACESTVDSEVEKMKKEHEKEKW